MSDIQNIRKIIYRSIPTLLVNVVPLRVIYNRDLIEIIREKGSIQSITGVTSKKALSNFLQNKYKGFNWNDDYIEMIKKKIVKLLVSSRKWSTVNHGPRLLHNFRKQTF